MDSVISTNQVFVGTLIFLRIGGILFALPVVGDQPTPVRVRLLLALALTICLYPIIPSSWMPNLALDPFVVANYVIRELLIGVVIGFVARVAFDGIVMASTLVAYQMGFGTGQLFMPDFGGQIDAFTAFHRALIMLIFFTLGLHHIFFTAIMDSFLLIPGGAAQISGSLGPILTEITAGVLVIAVQLSAPILVALLFTMAALGLVARTVPQMNVFVMSFPISFAIGVIVYIATLPMFPSWLQDHFIGTHDQITAALRAMVH